MVGAHHNALDDGSIVQRLQRHHHLRRGAVGIGDDHPLLVAVDGLRVHFRHDQRHIMIHAEQAAVVDHHAALRSGLGGIDFGRAGASGKQRDIPAGEIEMLKVLHLDLAAGLAKLDLVAHRTRGGDGSDIVQRELPFRQDVQHFAPDTAGGAHNNDLVTHGCAPWAAAVTGFGRRVQFSAPESIGPVAR